ncbi:hypothetical protein ACJMK2_042334 [Sinanodonta woodiana]|uniref:Uncharacterized protein n=1 Tax=Sinanodonta woodiana TaxID=1069815 RepID=A0ABD3W6Z4_SINWO
MFKDIKVVENEESGQQVLMRLTLCSGLNILNESVVTAISKFLEELLLNPMNTKIIDLVLFPDVIFLEDKKQGIIFTIFPWRTKNETRPVQLLCLFMLLACKEY